MRMIIKTLARLLAAVLVVMMTEIPVQTFAETIRRAMSATQVCQALTPSSAVEWPISLGFFLYQNRFFSSSQQDPTCIFKPTQASDLASGMKMIGQSKVPFAIASGKHSSNQGFSSTTGIQIDLAGFKNVNLSADHSYADIGAGLLWDDVYKALDKSGFNVVGGRVGGVGVGGYIVGGGGYSWKTNQYGLTVDTLISVDMVLPDGTPVTASATSYPDLLAAVKGGGNQFGIIYNFRLATNPQTDKIYGGVRIYTSDQFDKLVPAIADFSATNKDVKAQILPTFNHALGSTTLLLLAIYDGPDPGTVFDPFNAIPHLIDMWKAQSYSDYVSGVPSSLQGNQRGLFHSVSLQEFSKELLHTIINHTTTFGSIPGHPSNTISFDVEPFVKSYGLQANKHGPTMFPHSNSPLPLNLYWSWSSSNDDSYFKQAALDSVAIIRAQAIAEGQQLDNFFLYPNYCLAETPAVQMYGTANAAFLRATKQKYDPNNIMGQTTYFSFAT